MPKPELFDDKLKKSIFDMIEGKTTGAAIGNSYDLFQRVFQELIAPLELTENECRLVPQEKRIKRYIESSLLELGRTHAGDDQQKAALLRKVISNLHRLLSRIPIQQGGFLSIFKSNRGELHDMLQDIFEKLRGSSIFDYKAIFQAPEFDDVEKTTSLDISYLNLTLDQVKSLGKLVNLTTLRAENIRVDGKWLVREGKFTEGGKEFVSSLSSLINLKILQLADNRFGADCELEGGLQDLIGSFEKFTSLEQLDLSSNMLNDAHLESILGSVDKLCSSRGDAGLQGLKVYMNSNFLTLPEDAGAGKAEESDQSLRDRLRDLHTKFQGLTFFFANNFISVTEDLPRNVDHSDGRNPSIESIIDPELFVSEDAGVVSITNKAGHAGLLLEKMDKNKQLKLLFIHLTGDRCCSTDDTKKIQPKFIPTTDIRKWVMERHTGDIRFWQTDNCKGDQIKTAVETVQSDPTGFCISDCSENPNCFSYAVSVYKQFFVGSSSVVTPTIKIPGFYVRDKGVVYGRRLGF